MDLVIRHRRITTPIKTILQTLRVETGNHYFKDIIDKGKEVLCSCPFHKDGLETRPACTVLNDNSYDLEYGTFNCFACKESGKLSKLVGKCLSPDGGDWTSIGEDWLVDKFGDIYVVESEILPEINLSPKKLYLNPDILNVYEYSNPLAIDYLTKKRKISKEVVDYFKIGFDKTDKCVTFPCWDERNNLVGIFKRSIYGKYFHIPNITPKPVYLLNEVMKNNFIDVVVCESQINCLTCWSWGFPSIALFGTGSDEQYRLLRRSGIRSYLLAFDGDSAGRSGRERFIKNMDKNVFISYVDVPEGKDVNDLTLEQFLTLERKKV